MSRRLVESHRSVKIVPQFFSSLSVVRDNFCLVFDVVELYILFRAALVQSV